QLLELLLADGDEEREVVAAVEEAARKDDLAAEESLRFQDDADELIVVEQHVLYRAQLPAGVPEHHVLAAVDLELGVGLVRDLFEPVRQLGSRSEHAGGVFEALGKRLGPFTVGEVRGQPADVGGAERELDEVAGYPAGRVLRHDELVVYEHRAGRKD